MHKFHFNRLKSINKMANANFASWLYASRTWLMLLFIVSFCLIIGSSYSRAIKQLEYDVYWGESMFYLLSDGCNIKMTSILFLITVSELPRRIGYQYNMLIRATRKQWLASQVLYCFWMALCMLLLVSLCVGIFMLPGISSGAGWSDNIRIFEGRMIEDFTLVPEFVRETCTPFSACIFAALPMFLFWFTMVLVILFFSLCGLPIVGVLVYALSLTAPVVFLVEAFGSLPMPIDYATFDNITQGWPNEEFARLFNTLGGYGVLLLFLFAGMILRIRKTELHFSVE